MGRCCQSVVSPGCCHIQQQQPRCGPTSDSLSRKQRPPPRRPNRMQEACDRRQVGEIPRRPRRDLRTSNAPKRNYDTPEKVDHGRWNRSRRSPKKKDSMSDWLTCLRELSVQPHWRFARLLKFRLTTSASSRYSERSSPQQTRVGTRTSNVRPTLPAESGQRATTLFDSERWSKLGKNGNSEGRPPRIAGCRI